MPKMYLALVFILLNISLTAQDIDVQHITLDLTFDWSTRRAIGTATITMSMRQETNCISLDAGFLSIEKILVNEKLLIYQYNEKDSPKNLSITLDRVYASSELITLHIDYYTNYVNNADPNSIGGSFGKGLRFFQPTATTPMKRKQLWSSGEPESNKYWFPCNEDITDLHTTEIIATIEKPLMLISSGKLVKVVDNTNGTQTFHYKSDIPFPNYLVAIAVGEYTDVVQSAGPTTIHTFGYPSETEAVKATVELLPDMLQFLKEKTGCSYPFMHYKQVVVQDYPFPGSVGQHSMALLSDNYIDDYGVHKDFKYLWDGVAMQSLTNQWFGNIIMPISWKDIWLNNAFAQYFAGLYTEEDNGRAEYLLWYYPFEKGAVLNDWYSGNKHAIVPNQIEDLFAFTSDSYSSFKGALILRMLQYEMGDNLWWKTVRDFVATSKYKQVGTTDFQKVVEKVSGESYQWFFDQWFYNIGLPKLEVSKSYNGVSKILTVSVEQIQEKDTTLMESQVSYFQGSIAIEIDGKMETVFLEAQKENNYRFTSDQEPSFVNFNVENRFLAEVEFSKNVDEYLTQLAKSKDMLAKQEALNQLIAIANNRNVDDGIQKRIRSAVIDEVYSKCYWRYRMISLNALARMSDVPYDGATVSLLKDLIENEGSWLKSTAITFLGNSGEAKYAHIYMKALSDESDRVVNAAAIALGKSKSSKAYDVLMSLENQSSWKNQNRISALNGLQQLGDLRAVDYILECIEDNRSPRWYLATPRWDYPFAAVNALVSLGEAGKAYPILLDRFRRSLAENDVNDIFQNVLLINLLKDERAKSIYSSLKDKFETNAVILDAVNNYEQQFLESIK